MQSETCSIDAENAAEILNCEIVVVRRDHGVRQFPFIKSAGKAKFLPSGWYHRCRACRDGGCVSPLRISSGQLTGVSP